MANNVEYEGIIKEAVTTCCDETGWANLAEVGAILKQNGVKYKKLLKFLSEYDSLVELRTDDSRQPPVVYAKIIAA